MHQSFNSFLGLLVVYVRKSGIRISVYRVVQRVMCVEIKCCRIWRPSRRGWTSSERIASHEFLCAPWFSPLLQTARPHLAKFHTSSHAPTYWDYNLPIEDCWPVTTLHDSPLVIADNSAARESCEQWCTIMARCGVVLRFQSSFHDLRFTTFANPLSVNFKSQLNPESSGKNRLLLSNQTAISDPVAI